MSEVRQDSSIGRLREFRATQEVVQAQLRADFIERQSSVINRRNPARSSLVDNVIGLHGADLIADQNILENYEKVAASLVGKKGQPVIVVKRWLDSSGSCTGFGGKSEESLMRTLYMGKLSGEKLQFEFDINSSIRSRAFLPTHKFIKCGRQSHFGTEETHSVDGRIPVSGFGSFFEQDTVFLGSDLGRKLPMDDNPGYSRRSGFGNTIYGPPIALEIAIGAKEIQDWINLRGEKDGGYTFKGEYLKLKEMAELLGLEGVEPTTEHLRQYYLGEE